MVKRNEVLLKSNNEWLYYSNPHRIISATNLEEVRNALNEVDGLVNSNNWYAAGFLSYEAAPAFDNALRVIQPEDDFPLLWFGLYSAPQGVPLPPPTMNSPALDWKPTIERSSYNSAIEKVKDYIAQGKTYQVNYTMRLASGFENDEWDFFLNLARTQNKYAAYIDTGRYVVCSASPELFFKMDGGRIFSHPMKGTVKRGRTTAEDSAQSQWLHDSIKNRAENVMIVDMVRNDLGRIAKIGSVQAPELFRVEKYPTLFQMTSLVQAITNAPLIDIFSALFPSASITGAPKVSTMNIIAELETTPRKIYTGSIGYISPNRKAQFNVAIRTALIDREIKKAEYGVGGGVIWDSTSADEYSEALLKARVLTEPQLPPGFSLIETLLWTSQEGYFLREKHIQRMCNSAEYFDFISSKEIIGKNLDELAKGFDSPRRVRLLLDREGKLTAEDKPYQDVKSKFKVILANEPIDSNNPFIFHKTTRREIYEAAREGLSSYNDTLLYNELEELTEFTIGNLVVELNGNFFTPPVSCGLLPGTFRSHLLETGQIRERILPKNEIETYSKIFLINSVRKWVEVKI